MDKQVRVLIVEDSEADTELLVRELEGGGYRVVFKRVDTEDGFLAALKEKWDLIISDYAMPTFSGLRAFELFTESGLDVPFIFVSGALGEERAVEAMKAGARDYILKGNLNRLTVAIDRELEEATTRSLKRALDAASLKEQKRLSVALQATGAGVFEYRLPDGQGYYSPRFAEILGYAVEELPRFEQFIPWFFDSVHEEDVADARNCYDDFIAGRKKEYAVEIRFQHKDGRWIYLSCLAAPSETDEAGRVIDWVGVILDQTEKRGMEEQFRQAQKMEAVGRLAGGVAHDFNNLLTIMSSFGAYVLDTLEAGSTAYEDMEEVLNATRRAEKLTDQLLAFSRRRPMDPQVMNINKLVGELDKMLRRLLGADIEYVTDLSSELWNTRIDAGSFEQVVVNLAINARDAMPNGGRLTIETSNSSVGDGYLNSNKLPIPPGDYVIVSVTDNGTGMDQQTQEKIFEPFFTTKGPQKGTGLGLATCYGIVKQANGFIWVYSEPGHGTTFRVLLPRVHDCVPNAIATEAEAEVKAELKISASDGALLVVEDDRSVRKFVTRVLTELGYPVLEAANGTQALEVARSNATPIRLLVTDVVMPEMTGPQLLEHLEPLHPGMKTLFMSGYTRGALEFGNDVSLLQKPFSPEHLTEKVHELLGVPVE